MKNLNFLFLVLLAFLFQSCATIFSGTNQNISFSSNPSGADIYINNRDIKQKTPATIKVDRKVKATSYNSKNQYNYSFKHEGYEDIVVTDMAQTNGVIWLNLIGGGLALFTIPIDYASGASKKFNENVHANLVAKRDNTRTIIQEKIVYVPTGGGSLTYVFNKNSDVDKNIPITPNKNENRYALIIGNEDYSSHQLDLSDEVNVDFARNDASAFKEYTMQVMGIPEENIIFMLDATTGKMNQGIAKANKILKATNGTAELFVYYAGHGLPDEQTKEAYIMPVDVSGKNAYEGIALKDMYSKLTEYPSKRVTVFIDACFSGGARNHGLLAARGVKINPKESPLVGNLVVFSASSGEQSSLPYKQQEHGMFTYYLLKKLQDTGGQVTYDELSNYVIDKVSLKSVLINDKEQNPKVNVSSGSSTNWKKWVIN